MPEPSAHRRRGRVTRGRSAPFARIEDAVAALRTGKMVVVVDDEDRENEGDLTIAAAHATPEAINFMARHGRGLICLATTGERLDRLDIRVGISSNPASRETAFCTSIDAIDGVSTGISAADRAATIQTAIAEHTRPRDLARPGHVFPLRARDGGVLERAGHTEAAVDLARLAGRSPAGVICEIMNDDGTMARTPDLARFARKHRLLMVTIADLVGYRMRTEHIIRRVASANMPTVHGDFRIHAFQNAIDAHTHVALVRGGMGDGENVLVGVHATCVIGDGLRSTRCECGARLDAAMRTIAEAGRGVLLYVNHVDSGGGLASTIRAYERQDVRASPPAVGCSVNPCRQPEVGSQILRELGVRSMRVLSASGHRGAGIDVYRLFLRNRTEPETTRVNVNSP